MSRLLGLTNVQACMVYSNKKVYWSCSSVNPSSFQSCTFCKSFSYDCHTSSLIRGILMAFTRKPLLLLGDVSCTFNSFAFISYSSPLTFIIIMETFFPSKPRLSAVSILIKLICALESKSTFPRLYSPVCPLMSAVITGSRASWLSVTEDMLTCRSVLLCNREWWYHEH